jgi:hypothetical protein
MLLEIWGGVSCPHRYVVPEVAYDLQLSHKGITTDSIVGEANASRQLLPDKQLVARTLDLGNRGAAVHQLR